MCSDEQYDDTKCSAERSQLHYLVAVGSHTHIKCVT